MNFFVLIHRGMILQTIIYHQAGLSFHGYQHPAFLWLQIKSSSLFSSSANQDIFLWNVMGKGLMLELKGIDLEILLSHGSLWIYHNCRFITSQSCNHPTLQWMTMALSSLLLNIFTSRNLWLSIKWKEDLFCWANQHNDELPKALHRKAKGRVVRRPVSTSKQLVCYIQTPSFIHPCITILLEKDVKVLSSSLAKMCLKLTDDACLTLLFQHTVELLALDWCCSLWPASGSLSRNLRWEFCASLKQSSYRWHSVHCLFYQSYFKVHVELRMNDEQFVNFEIGTRLQIATNRNLIVPWRWWIKADLSLKTEIHIF